MSPKVVVEDGAVYLMGLYQAERGVADSPKILMSQPLNHREIECENAAVLAQEAEDRVQQRTI